MRYQANKMDRVKEHNFYEFYYKTILGLTHKNFVGYGLKSVFLWVMGYLQYGLFAKWVKIPILELNRQLSFETLIPKVILNQVEQQRVISGKNRRSTRGNRW